jgi:hypothetical protein
LIVHVGPAVVPFEYDVVEAGGRKVKHVLVAGQECTHQWLLDIHLGCKRTHEYCQRDGIHDKP